MSLQSVKNRSLSSFLNTAGFHHSDLRLANVMEIFVPDPADTTTEETATERRLSANIDELQKAASGPQVHFRGDF